MGAWTPEVTSQDEFFRSRLKNLISPRHPLARQTDWERLTTELGTFSKHVVVGQPAKATHLIAVCCT